jgi:acyl-CoA synthetase (AMP-forming)/AMP-acid ligase II
MRILRKLGDEETVQGLLRSNAELVPDRVGLIALDDNGKEVKKYTYKEYFERAQAVAAALIAKKVKQDDRIILVFLPGTVDACVAFFGVLFTGAIPVCVHPPDPRSLSRDAPKFAKVVSDCNPVLIITNTTYYRYAHRPFTGVKWPPVPWVKLNDLKKKKKNAPPPPSTDKKPAGSLAFLQYTVWRIIAIALFSPSCNLFASPHEFLP